MHPRPKTLGQLVSWKSRLAANLELGANDLKQIEDALSQITIVGGRYPAHLQKLVGR
jgi:hypothetical protein